MKQGEEINENDFIHWCPTKKIWRLRKEDCILTKEDILQQNREDILNDYVQEYKLEGGPSYVVDGACEAYLETLKQM
jgi:hypothetical protein